MAFGVSIPFFLKGLHLISSKELCWALWRAQDLEIRFLNCMEEALYGGKHAQALELVYIQILPFVSSINLYIYY